MKTILSLRKHSYLKIIGTFIVAIALIAGIVGCDGTTPVQYDLVVGSGAGGSVISPGEGTYTYDEGDVVTLVAVPDCGYTFDVWTGDTAGITDVNAASTNITMNTNYDINASFKIKPLSHFKGYEVDDEAAPYIDQTVSLTDQFVEDFVVEVEKGMFFFNPAQKVHLGETTPIYDIDHHFVVYHIGYEGDYPVRRSVEVTNQFGTQTVSVFGPVALAVPSTKVEPGNHEDPKCLDHFLLYQVEEGTYMEEYVDLTDQFGTDENITVYQPYYFANPVQKTDATGVTEIELGEHLMFYAMDGTTVTYDQTVKVDNQFGAGQTFDLPFPAWFLAAPSQKDVPPTPPLDHFKCYPTLPHEPLDLLVDIWDQFHSDYLEDVVVLEDIMFCNPVDKVHDTLTTSSNPDNHLTIYKIFTEDIHYYSVIVNNQFGNNQELSLRGPFALAVPTQKIEPGSHERPEYLNHYLLYEVSEGLNVTATVDLDDQFPEDAKGVEVTKPVYFATPVVKGYVDHSGIWDPRGHLVFYDISPNIEFLPGVMIMNQFFPEDAIPLALDPEGQQYLAVPSVKVSWEFLD